MISENFRLFDEVMPFVCLLILKSKPSHQKVLFYDIVYVITKMYKNVWTHWGMLTITSARENPYWWTGVYPTDTWLIYTRIYTYKRVPRVSCHQLLDKNILCCHKNGIQIFRNGNICTTLRDHWNYQVSQRKCLVNGYFFGTPWIVTFILWLWLT